nr:receptor-like protein kinase FERONIA [Ipomoea batatas]
MLSMIYLLLHLLTTTTCSGGSPAYSPPDHILHNCGGASKQDSNGRNWTSDAYYPECLLPDEPDISVTYKGKAVAAGNASIPDVPYSSVHIFVNKCTRSYAVSPGPKFIRLHFSPKTHYSVPGFSQQPEDSFFSVNANEYTLMANFSAFLTLSDASVVEKEYIVNVNANRLDITFTPSPNSFAFVNGIEIVSIPTGYYIRGEAAGVDDNPIKWVPWNNNYFIFNNTALETLYRLDVGGPKVFPVNDTGMDRTWYSDDNYVTGLGYFTPSLDVNITYTSYTPAYSAPEIVYTTSRTIANDSNVVNWTFPVDSGFLYLFRLYFCEFEPEIGGANERVFSVDIANITADSHVDVFLRAGGSKIPVFRDYLVNVPDMDGRRNKQNVSFAIRPNMATRPEYASAILNGLEIFKLNDTQGSMAVGLNLEPPVQISGKKAVLVGAIVGGVAGGVAVVVILVFLVNFRRRVTRDSATNVTSSESSSKTLDFSQSELCRHFSLDELKSATADFDESYVIGKGGFGKVYRASINQSDCSIEDCAANDRRCLRREPRQRPDMADVVKNLELAVALQQRAELALNDYQPDTIDDDVEAQELIN